MNAGRLAASFIIGLFVLAVIGLWPLVSQLAK